MRYRYLIIELINEVVFGTDDRKDAKVYTSDDNYIVVDAEAGIVMNGEGEDNYSVLSLADGLPEADDLAEGDDYDDDDLAEADDLAEVTYHLVDEERPRTAQARRPNRPFDYLRGKYGRQE